MESTGTKAKLDTHLLVWSQSVKFQSNPSSIFAEFNCVNSCTYFNSLGVSSSYLLTHVVKQIAAD